MNRELVIAAAKRALSRVAPETEGEEIVTGLNLREQFDLDSMDFVAFVLELEKELGTRIPELDYPRLSSFDGCAAYLERST